ncbi:MAG: histidine kinase [Saprospiraceae bacterium]
MRLYIILLSICFACLAICSQAQKLIGAELKSMEALIDSAEFYKLKSPNRTHQLSMEIISHVPVKENEELYVHALLLAANSEKMLSRKEESLNHSSQALAIANQVNNRDLMIKSNFMKGSIFGQDDVNDSALVYYQKVIDLHRPGIDPYYVSSAYTSVGQVYTSIGSYQKAEEYLLKGYQLSSGDDYAKLFSLASVISFYVIRDNPKYLSYLDTLAMSDFYKKASAASFMAHFDSFLLLDEATDEEKEKKLKEVYTYSFTHSSKVNQVGYGMKLYGQLDKMQKYKEAYVLLQNLYQKALNTENKTHIAGVVRALYENSKARGDLLSALKYLEEHSQLRDSLLSEENMDRISELNIKFEAAQKDHEIEQQKIRLGQERRDRNFFVILAIVLCALAIVIFIYFRNRARSVQRISEQEKIIHLKETEQLQKEKEMSELTATLESQERERNRIARDLHDGIGSMMSGISSQIEYLRSQPVVEQAAHSHLVELRDMVKEATSELRRTSYELMPAKLLRLGLEPAIRDLCLNLLVKNGIEPTMEINADLSILDAEQQLGLYRIIQEVVNNVVKHAEARHVLIQFNYFDHEISLVVEDDGKGFDFVAKSMNGGLGLGSLQSRVNVIKGFLDIASIPGEGTTVTVNFPVLSPSPASLTHD